MIKNLLKNFLKKFNLKIIKLNQSQPKKHPFPIPSYKEIELIKNSKGVLHIGAHRGTEAAVYDWFNKSVLWIEADPEIFEELMININKHHGQKAICCLLGHKNQSGIPFYVSNNDGACSSIFKFSKQVLNKKLWKTRNFFTSKVKFLNMYTLDTIAKKKKLNLSNYNHWIMDIQGAELDVFKGASNILKDVLMIVSEVEFVEHYKNQPLFGNVSEFLNKKNFMFHKFLGLSGRALKPVILKNNENFPSQHIWSDAMFILNFKNIYNTSDSNLLKMAVLSFLYNSPDLTFFYLKEYDKRRKTFICESYQKIF